MTHAHHEISVEFAPDEHAADSMAPREALTEADLAERELAIADIRGFVSDWITKKLAETAANKEDGSAEYSSDMTADLVYALGTEGSPMIERITASFDNREKYINRPMIRLNVGKEGLSPDIWLLGWRSSDVGDDETEVHDHGNSEAAAFIHQGDVSEKVWAFDAKEWDEIKDGSVGGSMKTFTIKRELKAGTTANIAVPYIHTFSAITGKPLAVTVHGYYPPLSKMNTFQEKDGKLVLTDSWNDEEHNHC